MCVYIHVLIVWHDNIVDYNIMYIRTSTATQKTSITCFSSIVIEYVDNGLCIRTIYIYMYMYVDLLVILKVSKMLHTSTKYGRLINPKGRSVSMGMRERGRSATITNIFLFHVYLPEKESNDASE